MRPVSTKLYPFAQNFFEVRPGVRMNYVDEGTGDGVPVVMVHGNPTWSFYYRDLIRTLSADRRCIAPDHIGCGYSDKPSDADYRYTLESRVDDLEALLDALDLPLVDLVVHDWGGMIGTAWATRHPDRVRRLVILNTAAFPNPKGQRLPSALRLARDSRLGALLVRGFNAFSRGATLTCTTRTKLSKDVVDGYVAPYDSWDARIATLRFVQDIPLGPEDDAYAVVQSTADALPSLEDKPMLIGWGMKDFVFDAAFLEEWERRFPAAKVYRYDDCGHYILEDARDELLALIPEFFDA